MSLPELICAAVIAIGMPNAERACEHMELVVEVSEEADIQPEVLVALIHVESRWTPSAVSRANACGLTQVIPRFTGGRASNRVRYNCTQLKDSITSIRAGASIFGFWLHNYGRCQRGRCVTSNYRIGLCGYNAGYRCRGDNPNRHGVGYARAVLNKASQIRNTMRRIENDHRSDTN